MKKTVLVTGSSRGIGKAIAVYLANNNYDLVLHCRNNRAMADELAKELKHPDNNIRVLQFDVSDREQCHSIISEDIAQNGAYYGVVCNAGLTRDTAFPAMLSDEWDDVIETNLNSFYNVLHPIVMPMVRTRKPARIITLASVSGIIGNRGQVNYSASKGGIIAASKSLALELAKRNITVNCVAPGLIETDMTEDVEMDEIKKMIPLRRAGKPEEVASAVNYLLSDAAAYITRQVISVNGGLC